MEPYKFAVDDALVQAHLGVALDSPREEINKLLSWHESIGRYFALQDAIKICDDLYDTRVAGGFIREASAYRNLSLKLRELQEVNHTS